MFFHFFSKYLTSQHHEAGIMLELVVRDTKLKPMRHSPGPQGAYRGKEAINR